MAPESDRKRWAEIVVMPLAIALVGGMATFLITSYQTSSAERLAQATLESAAARARLEQQLKVLEIFAQRITSKDPREKEIAVRLLKVLDAELGEKIASVVASTTAEEPEVRQVARSLFEGVFEGFWRNVDPRLHFIQFLDIANVGRDHLRIRAWLRCGPTPYEGGTFRNCLFWGPDDASIDSNGVASWRHPGERVGDNTLSLEGRQLVATTKSTGWKNVFERAPRPPGL
jgi:hypothetical protein